MKALSACSSAITFAETGVESCTAREGESLLRIAAVIFGLAICAPGALAVAVFRATRSQPFDRQIRLGIQVPLALGSAVATLLLTAAALWVYPVRVGDSLLLVLAIAGACLGHYTYTFFVASEEAFRRLDALDATAAASWRTHVAWYAARLPWFSLVLVLGGCVGAAYLGWLFAQTAQLGGGGSATARTFSVVLYLGAAVGACYSLYLWLSRIWRDDYWMWRDVARLAWVLSPKHLETRLAAYCDRVIHWVAQERGVLSEQALRAGGQER